MLFAGCLPVEFSPQPSLQSASSTPEEPRLSEEGNWSFKGISYVNSDLEDVPEEFTSFLQTNKNVMEAIQAINQRKLALLVACCLSEDKINDVQKMRIESCISVHQSWSSWLKTKRYENFLVRCHLTPDAKSDIRSIGTSPYSWMSVTDNCLCTPRCSDSINPTNVFQ